MPKQVAPAKAPCGDHSGHCADEWWKKRQAAFNERVTQAAEKGDAGDAFIGDSITQGWEGEGKERRKVHAKRNAINLGSVVIAPSMSSGALTTATSRVSISPRPAQHPRSRSS